MSQRHGAQHGIFHVTTNAAKKIPWMTMDGVPEIIIDNLMMTRNVHCAHVHAFCILPDHMHIILTPGKKGLSAFVHSFKRNSSKDIRAILGVRSAGSLPARYANHDAGVNEPRLREAVEHPNTIRWHNGFHDELIRDEKQRTAALSYVQYNAGNHNLVTAGADWPWTSLHFPHLLDPLGLWFE